MPAAPDDRRHGNAARTPTHSRDHLLELLTPVVDGAGYELEDISVSAAGRRSLIKVIVDADGGIDMDAVATVARLVSSALDDDPSMDSGDFAGPYQLEVSSPGVDRPLTEPRHWRRSTGRLVQTTLTTDGAQRSVSARVLAVAGDGVELDIQGKGGGRQLVPWARLGNGKVQVEFNRKGGEGVSDEALEPFDGEEA